MNKLFIWRDYADIEEYGSLAVVMAEDEKEARRVLLADVENKLRKEFKYTSDIEHLVERDLAVYKKYFSTAPEIYATPHAERFET